MKRSILGACLALASLPAMASTSYECQSTAGERVLVQFESFGTSMSVEYTEELGPDGVERFEFPDLNPFLEREPTKLSSLTHVATMISHFEDTQEIDYFPFVHVTIDLTGEVSKVAWKLSKFGGSESYEVVCDQKGLWTTVH